MLYLAGVPINSMLRWTPHPGRQLGMAISIMSYKGMATLTVITEQFNIEFQSLLKARVTQSSQSR